MAIRRGGVTSPLECVFKEDCIIMTLEGQLVQKRITHCFPEEDVSPCPILQPNPFYVVFREGVVSGGEM